ncbi:unnamed protein product [Diatraea saccharalis]|uniref:G-protein coupled receptors family 2 profile 2 domain-containing protein n=1 Tax=Diatraea saccharalis TaxID=40085 RepID=A0A9N9WDY6_9NEOP|nr:unnamed protein product [Diatraea saccharalis]
MIIILLIFALFDRVVTQSCIINVTKDITGAKLLKDNSFFVDGVLFPKKHVFERNVSGEMKTYGCICDLKKCFHKCCPLNQVMYKKICTEMPGMDMIMNGDLSLNYVDSFKRSLDVNNSEFALVYGKPCSAVYLEIQKWYLQEDGNLYVEMPNLIPPWSVRGPDTYCIDTFVLENPDGTKTTRMDALACFETSQEEHYYLLTSTCMLTSCLFILATCAVYAWLPELRNLHGKVLMAYLLCLFFGFCLFSAMQILLYVDNITTNACIILTIAIYFFLLSAFFWLNVMSFDIWWTFSGKRGLSLEKLSTQGRFYAYAMYAFSIPTALTILMTALEFSGLPPHPWLPMIKQQGCFLYGTSKLIYFYGPIVVLCLANMVFFILTAVKITQIKKQTAVLKSKESSRHDQHKKDKQRLLLYIKLFAVMGINWILEVISALYPGAYGLWRVTDVYNVLIGLTIFIIFVCKRKIYYLIKKRIKERYHHNESDGDLRAFDPSRAKPWLNKKYETRGSVDTIKSTVGEEPTKNEKYKRAGTTRF